MKNFGEKKRNLQKDPAVVQIHNLFKKFNENKEI